MESVYIVIILAVAVLPSWLLAWAISRSQAKDTTTQLVASAFRASMSGYRSKPEVATEWARSIVAPIIPEPTSRLVGGGTAITSPIGEALFALTVAATDNYRTDPGVVLDALGALVRMCVNGGLARQMTAMDDEMVSYAAETYTRLTPHQSD